MTPPGRAYEDFVIGERVTLGARAVSDAEIRTFAGQFDPRPQHLEPGGVASPWHVAAMFMQLYYDGLLAGSTSLGSPGLESIAWPSPVRGGDRLLAELVVTDLKPSRSRPEMGLVRFDLLVANQHGDCVMQADSWSMFGRRGDRP